MGCRVGMGHLGKGSFDHYLACKSLRKAYVVEITTSEITTCCGVFDVVKITISCGVIYKEVVVLFTRKLW